MSSSFFLFFFLAAEQLKRSNCLLMDQCPPLFFFAAWLGDTLIASVWSEESVVSCTNYTAYWNAPLLFDYRTEGNIQRQNVKDVSHPTDLGAVGCFQTFRGPRSCELVAFYFTTPRPHWLIRRQPSVPSHSLRTLAQPSRQEDASALRH